MRRAVQGRRGAAAGWEKRHKNGHTRGEKRRSRCSKKAPFDARAHRWCYTVRGWSEVVREGVRPVRRAGLSASVAKQEHSGEKEAQQHTSVHGDAGKTRL